MTTNFEFLKNTDKNLYTIISEAEMLYRDEYFEQCMVQTRRFGEHVCKKVLGNRCRGENTFDEMLATLKDKITGEEQEKEFIEDLYFLKKHGNNSAHSIKVHKDGIEALECLQRAFEAAISYCVYFSGAAPGILKLRYDTELLVTGVKTKKSLAEKYHEKKQEVSQNKKNKKSVKPAKQQSHKMITQKKKSTISGFQIFVVISAVVSAVLLISIVVLGKN